MFTSHLDLIETLKSQHSPFVYLYQKYEKMDAEVKRLKKGGGEANLSALIALKQEKRLLHHEIYSILTKLEKLRA